MVFKKLKKAINSIKITAVFTAVCFLISTVGTNLYALSLSQNAAKKYEDAFNKISPISVEYGKITSVKDAKSDITVINIQDLHCHPQTQKNISKIIEQIKEKYNLSSIYVEGGYGNIDTSWLNAIRDEQIKKQVINKLLEEGILTGAEYFSLTSDCKNIELKGIDDKSLHMENLKRLSQIIKNQDKYKQVCDKISKEISFLEKTYVNERNRRFNKSIQEYVYGKVDAKKFYRQLIKYVNDINDNPQKYNNITSVKLDDYPNIEKYMALKKSAQKVNVNKVSLQLKDVLSLLKNRVPYNVYSRLLKDTDNLTDSRKTLELVTSLCEKENINIDDDFKDLSMFLKMNEIGAQINGIKLVLEERQLVEQIKMALSYSLQEYEITYISDFEKYFKDYLQYKLTENDWIYFKRGFAKFNALYGKYASVNRIKEIENDFEQLNKYYEINDARNDVFVKNLLQNKVCEQVSQKVRSSEEVLKNSKDVIVAVTGGFHSGALKELLSEKHVNTIIVTPSIYESVLQANEKYSEIIQTQSEINSQALAYTLASCSDGNYQKELLFAALTEILGQENLSQIEDVFEGADLGEIEKYTRLKNVSSEQKDKTVNILKTAVDEIFNDVSDLKNILLPAGKNIDDAMLKVVRFLIEDMSFYFADGEIFEIENSQFNGKDLHSIPAEIYSRMMPSLQKALLNFEIFKAEKSGAKKDGSVSDKQRKVREKVLKTEELNRLSLQGESKESSLSESRKEELLNRFYERNGNALDKLIEVSQKYGFDISQDTTLLEILIDKINTNIYWNTNLDDIIDRIFNVYNTGKVDTALKYSCLAKYVDTFGDEDEYMELFDTLFSLDENVIEYFYNKIDESYDAETLLAFYESYEINKYFSTFFQKFGKEFSELTDTSRIEFLFDNFMKLEELSKSDFQYLISLRSTDLFAVVLNNAENSSDIVKLLNFVRKYNVNFLILNRKITIDIIKNFKKVDGITQDDFISLIKLNEKAASFILENIEKSSDIAKVFELCKKFKVFYDYNDSENVKDFVDIKFKAVVKYAASANDSFFEELFLTKAKELKIIVNSIDDGTFVRDYILNKKHKTTYFNLIEKLAALEIKNVATENNHLALKLVIDDNFNDILTASGLENVSDEDNIVARYHAAIAVSRFVFDSIGAEITDYDFNSQNFRKIINEALTVYIKYVEAMKEISLIDKDTEIFALLNNESYDGTRPRFNVNAMNVILSYVKEHKEINSFERAQDESAADKWLNSIRTFAINDIFSTQKAYFFFRGHGGKDALEIVSPQKDKVFRGTKISKTETVKSENITVEQMTEALIYAATRQKNPLDLRNVTIDLSCCNSYYFARELYSKLKENGITSFPTILTAAGLETELGYTIDNNTGNLHKGIVDAMRVFGTEKASLQALTLDTVASMEYQMTHSNITMFTSFYNQEILDTIKESRREIRELYSDSKVSATDTVQENVVEHTDANTNETVAKTETVLQNLRSQKLQKVKILPQGMVEASIFSVLKDKNKVFEFLADHAHFWEELLFRTAPAIVAMINPMIGIPLFLVMQPLFVFSHTIVKWLVQKKSAGDDALSLKEITKKDFRSLSLPAAVMTLPYIISLALPLFAPAAILISTGIISLTTSTVVAQTAHYEYNKYQKNPSKLLSIFSFKTFYGKVRAVSENIETLKRELTGENVYEDIKNSIKSDEEFQKEFTKKREQTINLSKQVEERLKEKGIVIENFAKRVEQNIDNLNKFSFLLSEMYEILTSIDLLELEADTTYLKKLVNTLKKNFISLLENEFCEALINVYDEKIVTKKHVENVYKYSRIIAEHSGTINDNLDFKFKLVISAALHDIGKNLVPVEILNKNGKLTEQEFAIMKMHTLFGGLIMDGSIFEEFSVGAKGHHKNKNYGYDTEINKLFPEKQFAQETGTEQEQRLITDIINVADVYEALTAKRQYKDPLPTKEAFKIITGVYPEDVAKNGTEIIDIEKTGYAKQALLYFIDWYFEEHAEETLRMQVLSAFAFQTPLTMAQLKKTLDFFPIKLDTKLKIISIVEAPIIMLGVILPSINDFFLDQHKVSDINRQKLEKRLEYLDKSIKNKFNASYKFAKEKVKIPVISSVVAFCFATVKAFKINEKMHYYFNKFIYDSTYDKDYKSGIINLIEKNKRKIISASNSAYAHIREELLFRTVPAMVAMINPMIGIPLFLVMQPLFIFAHSIVKWLVEIEPNDKDITLKETVKNDFKSLSLPSAALAIPFVISLALPFAAPAANSFVSKALSLSVSTALSQYIHYEYNKNTVIELQLKVRKKNKRNNARKNNNASYYNDNDIRQPQGYTVGQIIQSFKKLAKSKTSPYKELELTQKQIKDLLLRTGVSQQEIDKIDFSQGYLPENIVSLLKSKNTQIIGTTINERKSLIENLKRSPILFSLAIETFLRVYENRFNENSSFGDLLNFIDERYSKKLYEATCTDLRGYFGEMYVVNTLIAGIIPDKRAGPIIIRPEMPEDNNARGFDVYDINKIKIQIKTGGKEIVTHHFGKYWRIVADFTGQGIIAIPVLTTKNIKDNNFYRDDRVQAIDVTTETVTKFAHELVSALYGIGYKKSIREVRDIKLKDLINSFKGFPTENPITTEELIDLLTNKNQTVKQTNKQKQSVQTAEPAPEIIDFNNRPISIEELAGQNVVVRMPFGQLHVLYVDKQSVSVNEKWRWVLQKGELASYGMEEINYDESGNITDIKFKQGTQVSGLKTDSEPVGRIENNIDFSQQDLGKLYSDTDTNGYVDLYLDDDIETISANIEKAAHKNKLIVVHVFKEGFITSDLKPAQAFEKYRQTYRLISNRFQLSDIFYSLRHDSKYTDFTLDFFLQEMLKNALVHGNVGKFELPIALHIKLDENKKVQTFSIYNKVSGEKTTRDTETLTSSAHLTGDHMGNEIMEHNPLRTLSIGETSIDGTKFWKATAVLKDEIDMQSVQWEKDYKNPKPKTQQEMLEEFWSVLPENAGLVNEQLKAGKTVLQTAFAIALDEINDSLKPDFEQRHSSLAGKQGARQIREFLEKYLPYADRVARVSILLGNVVRKLVIGASVIKHVIIDYRYIKSSGIKEAIRIFGKETYMDENGQVHVPPVLIIEDIEQIKDDYELTNTGIKVNGNSIYRIGTDGILVYGAKGVPVKQVSKVINESEQISAQIEKQLSKHGSANVKIRVESVIYGQEEGLSFEDGITVVGINELEGKSAQYISEYVTSAIEIKRSMAVTYGQKTIISLESIEETEKLKQALRSGKVRKIISQKQYEDLSLSYEEILRLRQDGVEIYIDSEIEKEEYKQSGVSGRIEKKEDRIYIKDYYSQDEIEVEEVGTEASITEIESRIVNSDKPILIDIKTLEEKFKRERDITGVYRGLGALIGNIKVKVGIGDITDKDIENIGYNLDYNRLPVLKVGTDEKRFIEAPEQEFMEILNIEGNSEIGIMIKLIKKQELREKFIEIIKGRVLAKAELTENNKEYGLKDKKLEKMLGEMLIKQATNKDKETVNIGEEFRGGKEEVLRKIMQESEKAYNNNEIAINTIIEIILVYGEEYKKKQVARVSDGNDMRTYRNMLAAA